MLTSADNRKYAWMTADAKAKPTSSASLSHPFLFRSSRRAYDLHSVRQHHQPCTCVSPGVSRIYAARNLLPRDINSFLVSTSLDSCAKDRKIYTTCVHQSCTGFCTPWSLWKRNAGAFQIDLLGFGGHAVSPPKGEYSAQR